MLFYGFFRTKLSSPSFLFDTVPYLLGSEFVGPRQLQYESTTRISPLHQEMAVVSVSASARFFDGELKQIARGENALTSQRLIAFHYNATTKDILATVKASMKDRTHEVQVRCLICHFLASLAAGGPVLQHGLIA